MDFVSGRRASSTDPLISRPVAKRKIVATKPSSSSAPKKVIKKPKVPSESSSVPKPSKAPVRSTAPAPSSRASSTPSPKPSVAKPSKLSEDSQKKLPEVPDNNLYTLGGKSPFLASYNVDKRPLSSSVPKDNKKNFEKVKFDAEKAIKLEDSLPKKNLYEKKSASTPEEKKKKRAEEVVVIDEEDKKSGIPTIIIALLTIILGAAAGVGIYFLLPK